MTGVASPPPNAASPAQVGSDVEGIVHSDPAQLARGWEMTNDVYQYRAINRGSAGMMGCLSGNKSADAGTAKISEISNPGYAGTTWRRPQALLPSGFWRVVVRGKRSRKSTLHAAPVMFGNISPPVP
jgi:hypothetical protein